MSPTSSQLPPTRLRCDDASPACVLPTSQLLHRRGRSHHSKEKRSEMSEVEPSLRAPTDQSPRDAGSPLSQRAGVLVPAPASARCSKQIGVSDWAELLPGVRREVVKPLSIMRWGDPGWVWKVYRGFEPYERLGREAEAVRMAAGWGIAVPRVLATGLHEDGPWSVFSVVPGTRRPLRSEHDVRRHLRDVRRLVETLGANSVGLAPGAGWAKSSSDAPTGHRQFLLEQLSERCRAYEWWGALHRSLLIIESEPTVYLHGDMKAEHFLIAEDAAHVVDWEACGRGPVACDHADVVFHLLRDLIHDGVAVPSTVVALLAELGSPGAVLAWRLVRWLDRRRPEDLLLVSPREVTELAVESDAAAACHRLLQVMTALRAKGVPR
ncbi:phosphotransferase family protein [Kribbella sp. NPDC056951]|uniref:phosphotransferase family protein n=1 Tax=Kribbella sp. NPDC056951 TaxID=3345978 RepID=UPI00363C6E9B